MPNERLRDAMLTRGLTPAAIAEQINVDPKTVERWITQDRNPYPRHRHAIAARLRESESYLWPNALSSDRASEVALSEVVQIYPRRGAVPPDIWQRLLNQADKEIGVLAYAALFLPEQNPSWVSTLREKAQQGAKVQILLGDPKSEQVAERGEDEGIGGSMAGKINNVVAFYKDLRRTENVGMYYHATTLYNSIYRFDDEMLVNTHLYGTPAAYAPIMHLRRLAGGELFDNYAASFSKVQARSRAIWPEDY
jgi:transcriptional regulator with XRE-family HTH domain